jgi:hypothetical protein
VPLECDPDSLAEEAKCFVDLSDGQRDAMLTVLVAALGGGLLHGPFSDGFSNGFEI